MKRLLPIALLLLLGCVTAGTVWPGLGPVALDYLQQRVVHELAVEEEAEVWIITAWDQYGNRMRCAAVPAGDDCPLCTPPSRVRVQIPKYGQDHALNSSCVLRLRSTGQLDLEFVPTEPQR